MDLMDFDSKTCRICFKKQETIYSLHCKQKGISLYEKLVKIGIKITVNDGGPSSICYECLAELDISINFLEKCEKSNQILREKLSHSLEFSKDIVDKHILNTEQENITIYSENSDVDNDSEIIKNNFKEEVKSNDTLSLGESKCGECGSKRRCRHWAPPTTHTCPYCQKIFNRKFNFKLHIARHKGVREWSCPTCGARAVSRWLAARHCAPRARAQCPVPGCQKTYTTNTNLQTHLRTHNGERPFKCSECDKKFASKNTLNDHRRIHTGALPYICPVCGKRFRTNKLSTHMIIHTNNARHICTRVGCALKFTSRRALLKHNKVHHPISAGPVTEPAYVCAMCPARYHHKQSLNKHFKKQHLQKSLGTNMLMDKNHGNDET